MTKILSCEVVKSRIAQRWGDFWDLSEMEYKGYNVRIKVTCKNGHTSWVFPDNLMRGHGCSICYNLSLRKKLYGIAYNDSNSGDDKDLINLWRGMLCRCYNPASLSKQPSYKGCSVCEEWLTFSNFRRWAMDVANGYSKGKQIDKDILAKGNKEYSPDTCCFVPSQINNLIIKSNKARGTLPIGVSILNGRYEASISIKNKKTHCSFHDTPEEAFQAYKTAKEAYIKEVAQEYYDRGEITEKVYDALMKYKVEITD